MAAVTQSAQENGAVYGPCILSDFESTAAPVMQLI